MTFTNTLHAFEFINPAVASGTLLTGLFLFIYIYIRTRNIVYLSMVFIVLFGFLFVASECLILTFGGWLHQASWGRQAERIEQIAGACFLFALPFFLSVVLSPVPGWKRTHRIMATVGAAVAFVYIIAAFAVPDSFVSMTTGHPSWMLRESDHGRGMKGPLYTIRDLLLGPLIIYGLVMCIIDMVRNKRFRSLAFIVTGLAIAIYGALDDMMFGYLNGNNIDPLNHIPFSRFTVGITFLIVFFMASLLRDFIDAAMKSEKQEREMREVYGRNRNVIVKLRDLIMRLAEVEKRMREASGNLTANAVDSAKASEGAEDGSTRFRELIGNLESAAVAQREAMHVSKTAVEQLFASFAVLSKSVEEQRASVLETSASVEEVTRSIESIRANMQNLLDISSQLTNAAAEAKNSVSSSFAGLQGIQELSTRISEAASLVKSIADKTNILSINASIQATKAGVYGRSFGVVAHEISTLAASSLKGAEDIETLLSTIVRSIGEIAAVRTRVESSFEGISSHIADTHARVTETAEAVAMQSAGNEDILRNTMKLKGITEEIVAAIGAQNADTKTISEKMDALVRETGNISLALDVQTKECARVSSDIHLVRETAEALDGVASDIKKLSAELHAEFDAIDKTIMTIAVDAAGTEVTA
ncbi:MAG: hypothetical protein HZC28_14165 [Spirochaetes bacterium]|nr:hypothetical protein [Spirochaetota bacterium]